MAPRTSPIFSPATPWRTYELKGSDGKLASTMNFISVPPPGIVSYRKKIYWDDGSVKTPRERISRTGRVAVHERTPPDEPARPLGPRRSPAAGARSCRHGVRRPHHPFQRRGRAHRHVSARRPRLAEPGGHDTPHHSPRA